MMDFDACLQVYQVDYGHNCVVPFHVLRVLPPLLQEMKPMCYKFALRAADCLPSAGFEVHEMFRSLVNGVQLELLVTGAVPSSKLQCCELFDPAGQNILHKMMQTLEAALTPLRYSHIALPLHSEYQIVVSHIDARGKLPWAFYVQLAANVALMDELTAQVTTCCSMQRSPETLHAEEGAPLLAQLNDSQWRRALVTSKSCDTRARVLYVDSGNEGDVVAAETRPASAAMVNMMPAQAIRCRLQPADMMDHGAAMFSELSKYRVLTMKVTHLLDSGELLVRVTDCNTPGMARDLGLEIVFNLQVAPAHALMANMPAVRATTFGRLPVYPAPAIRPAGTQKKCEVLITLIRGSILIRYCPFVKVCKKFHILSTALVSPAQGYLSSALHPFFPPASGAPECGAFQHTTNKQVGSCGPTHCYTELIFLIQIVNSSFY